MTSWKCPICDFKANGSEEEVNEKRKQHLQEMQDDPEHKKMLNMMEKGEDVKEKAGDIGEDIKDKVEDVVDKF